MNMQVKPTVEFRFVAGKMVRMTPQPSFIERLAQRWGLLETPNERTEEAFRAAHRGESRIGLEYPQSGPAPYPIKNYKEPNPAA